MERALRAKGEKEEVTGRGKQEERESLEGLLSQDAMGEVSICHVGRLG